MPSEHDLVGGGGRTRTYDLRIMSCQPAAEGKEDKELSSAESGKVLQNPQPPRNQEHGFPSTKPAEQEGSAPSAAGESPPRPPLSNPGPHKQ